MRKRMLLSVAVVLVVAGGLFYWKWWLPTRDAVAVGAGMLAKTMCSCLYVAGRPQDECRADQMSAMDAIQVEIDPASKRVRAFVPGLGERSAVYTEDLGCALQ